MRICIILRRSSFDPKSDELKTDMLFNAVSIPFPVGLENHCIKDFPMAASDESG